MSRYTTSFNETEYMSFLKKDDELLQKCNKIWHKVNNSIKNDLIVKPVYHEKYLKTKIKSYKGKIRTNFHDYGIPKKILIAFVYQ